ncbi:acetyl-CoA carboxylase carboxyl transferase subunit alpha [Candidatus Ishikawella capsulata]|uniref:Acetyl-coenzyme A carboxylase carboxyl transferase subunit alpha n=1 Tax=Candidatus Ishikawaella capsulata Mpkobe TaxID=476281 RepID=C5WCJ8_9ENTR|nr:acetyl-CoA carboxylase carboxyl transferase subunit alpha [Candidatus Ishikawaella capsulata]BAH83054.1 acetyl-CoA carboxylase subunit alpha [Candidatus Ishikawaella capsulata Mpkobe]
MNYLDFELPIVELETKINSLISIETKYRKYKINLSKEICNLRHQSTELTKKIFAELNSWQITQLARHPLRPHTMDYIQNMFEDFDELSGDRIFANDKAIICGIARLNGRSVIVIGHEKGREIKEKINCNFGMSAPEGYRKALRIMKMAERFNIPILTFIDTPGAYPGIGAEERGQSQAIAHNLLEMSILKVPIICTIIGEGGSGGALAIGIGDKVNMLEYSIYSVISPEGCAALLWKSIDQAALAATNMAITANRLKALQIIDSVIGEPLGGAHRNLENMADNLKNQLLKDLKELDLLNINQLLERRYCRLMSYDYRSYLI